MLLGALKHELGPLRSKMGPLSLIFLLFVFFLVCDFGPLPKNSGPNPMSFQFLVGVTLGAPMKDGLPLGKILATPLLHLTNKCARSAHSIK